MTTDRRRFLQTAAATGAVAWTVPAVIGTGFAAADGTVQPCTDGNSIFADNFDQECTSPSSGGFCGDYTGFVNWNVTTGTVDVVVGNQHGGCGPDESTGRSVDMDGTDALGTLEKIGGIPVVAGRSYLLRFRLGNNQSSSVDGSDNRVSVTFGSEDQEFPAPTDGGCDPFQLVLAPLSTGVVDLIFAAVDTDNNGDSRGAVLDDVEVLEYCTVGGARLAAGI